MKPTNKPKSRPCKHCKERYKYINNYKAAYHHKNGFCSSDCACTYIKAKEQIRQEKYRSKPKKPRHKQKPIKAKKSPKIILQELVNAISKHQRYLEHGEIRCVTCGKLCDETVHAGHYIAVATSNYLRYDLRNINFQCHYCNIDRERNEMEDAYAEYLITTYGVEWVEKLESDKNKEAYRNSVWYSENIKTTRKKLNELRKKTGTRWQRLQSLLY